MPAHNEDAPALNEDGSFKDASEMPDQFVNSPSDMPRPPRPASPHSGEKAK